MKKLFSLVSILCLISLGQSFASQGMDAIKKAQNEEKYIFFLFYNTQDAATEEMGTNFDGAKSDAGERANFLRIDITDEGEKELVNQYQLKNVPMPFVLVLSPNGAIMGAFPEKFDPQVVEQIFGTPGMEATLKALQEGKLAIVVIGNDVKEENLKGIREFQEDERFVDRSVLIFIDPTDHKETLFVTELGLDPKSKEMITLLFAPPANVIGKFPGSASKEELILTIQKAGPK